MVDLETMDNVATSAIVSIGAVECDLVTGEIGETFYRVIDLTDQLGTINADTLYWWMGQSESARKALLVSGKISIVEMCKAFYRWIEYLTAPTDNIRLWGNGASFDNSILRQTFRFYNHEFPTKYWNDRDMRTIVGFYPKSLQEQWQKKNLRSGTHHNALADAQHQVKYCSDILKELGVTELY